MTNQFPKSCSHRVAFFRARSISASMLGMIRLISSINNTSRAHTRHRSTEVARLLAVIWRLFSHCWTLHGIHGMSHVAVDLCTACVYSCSIETINRDHTAAMCDIMMRCTPCDRSARLPGKSEYGRSYFALPVLLEFYKSRNTSQK